MQFKQAMVPVSSIFDAQSGVCFADTTATITSNLNKNQLERYGRAMMKVSTHKRLNRSDLAVLDRIDEITYQHHGMCLKDSQVTKARLKGCKRYRIEFVDRDGLVDHMNTMNSIHDGADYSQSYCESLVDLFQEKLGDDAPIKLRLIVRKIELKENFNLDDLIFLSKLEVFADKELGWTIINEEIKSAIEKASSSLGIYFKNLQTLVAH